VLRGEISLGTVVAVLFYLRMIFWPLEELADKFNILQGAVVASERIFRILDTAPEPSAPARPEGRLRGHIEFRDVHFAYEPDKPVLRGVSFEVKPGEVLALVGPSGSGKTTIGALLLGFYPLQGQGSGQILVDGVPLEEWDRRQLRRNMALVQQDLFLFRGDVGHNLTLFSEVPPAALERALQVSRAAEVVERLPGGLAAPVQERGVTLSQGERQLLSFCRALATDPPVLILDEATASIDSKTEAAIQEALHGMLEGRTALVVAHRLSTIQEADRILVLKKGEIVEEGSHEELLARDGLYAHLYRTQMLAAEGRAAPAQTLPEAS
jgi:ABC-type multidrug transport system fused ATPase/permease subunit